MARWIFAAALRASLLLTRRAPAAGEPAESLGAPLPPAAPKQELFCGEYRGPVLELTPESITILTDRRGIGSMEPAPGGGQALKMTWYPPEVKRFRFSDHLVAGG